MGKIHVGILKNRSQSDKNSVGLKAQRQKTLRLVQEQRVDHWACGRPWKWKGSWGKVGKAEDICL